VPIELIGDEVAHTEARKLSKLLFECREAVEMYADIVRDATDREDLYLRELVGRIDSYRIEQGWSEHGFGTEV